MVNVEIPYLARCCCCLPLRRGILAWGYLKLTVLFLIGLIQIFYIMMAFMFASSRHDRIEFWLILVSSLLYYALEMVFTNVLLIGSHTKNTKVLRGYFYYMLVNIPVLVCLLISLLVLLITSGPNYRLYDFLMTLFCSSFIYTVINIYVVLLVRSEMKKLDDNAISFEFVNNAANSQCILNTDSTNII